MKINAINIDGFGIFHQASLQGLPPGLVLFLGHNEAGKSTLLGFIRTILFGFPRANSRDFNYPALAGGLAGGRLTLETQNGESFIVERKAGKGGGTVTVTGASGAIGGEDLLQQILGGVTYEVFKNIYAFSLSELQTLDTLQAQNVKSVIYGASAGSGMLALPKAEKFLKNRRELLFLPRAQKPLINVRLAELEQAHISLRQASLEMADYDQAWLEYRETEELLNNRQNELNTISRTIHKLSSRIQLWPEWLRFLSLEKAGREQPEVTDFPENGLALLEQEVQKLSTLQERQEELQEELSLLHARIAELSIDQGILEQAETINLLWQGRKEYLARLESLPLARQKMAGMSAELGGIIGSLGPEWSETRIIAVDRSIFSREQIRQYEEEFRRLTAEKEAAAKILTDREDQYRRTKSALDLAAANLLKLGEEPPTLDEELISRLRNGRDEFASVMRDIERRRGELHLEEEHLTRLIGEIDPEWQRDHIHSFDFSLSSRKIVEDFELRFKEAERVLQESRSLQLSIEKNLTRLREKLASAQSGFKPEAKDQDGSNRFSPEQAKTNLRLLRQNFFEHAQLLRESEICREKLGSEKNGFPQKDMNNRVPQQNRRLLFMGSLTILIVFSLLSLYLFSSTALTITAIPAGIGFFAALILLLIRGYLRRNEQRALAAEQEQRRQWQQEFEDIDERLLALENRIYQMLEKMDGTEFVAGRQPGSPLNSEILDRLEDQIAQESARQLEIRQKKETVFNLNAEITELVREQTLLQQDAAQKSLAYTSLGQEWQERLRIFGLNPELTPGLAKEIFSRVEIARQQLKVVNDLQKRIREMSETRDQYVEAARSVPPLAPFCQTAGAGLLSQLDGFLLKRQEEQKQNEERRQAAKIVEEKQGAVAAMYAETEQARVIVAAWSGKFEEVLGKWRQWLQEQNLPLVFSPRTCLELLDRLNLAVGVMEQRQRLHQEIAVSEEVVSRYEDEVFRLLHILGLSPVEAEKTGIAVERLFTGLEKSKGGMEAAKELEQRQKTIQLNQHNLARKIAQGREAIDALLQRGAARDIDDFRRRGALFSQNLVRQQDYEQTVENIRRISGEADCELLFSSLRQTNLEELENSEVTLSGQAGELEEELNRLRDQKANLNQQIERLQTADVIGSLRLQEEALKTELQDAAADWGCCTLASHLIARAREKFEKEQQPRVIQDAGSFFRRITGNRYHSLLAPIGEESIEVITARQERRSPDHLSRGAAEQLYLALRFGYIRNRTEKSDPLPVIMDDILVNSDPERAKNAAAAILELAAKHQILFFTCHPATIDIFRSLNSALPLYTLNNGELSQAS